MSTNKSLARRFANRLAAHAACVLPPHRAEWARAMRAETEHQTSDSAAVRWAAGSVVASYIERIFLMRSFALSAGLVLAGLAAIEGSHVLTQMLFQQQAIDLLTTSLPASLLAGDSGTFTPLGILLTVMISVPVAIVSYALGRALFRLSPDRARTAIKATIIADAIFLASVILIGLIRTVPGEGPLLAAIQSTAVLWAIRVSFVALPLVVLLYAHRPEPSATSAVSSS